MGCGEGFRGRSNLFGRGGARGGKTGEERGGNGGQDDEAAKDEEGTRREGSRECEPLASKTKPCTEHHLTAQAASPSKKRELEIQQHTCSNRMSQLSKKPAEGSM
jgi:hypothetical protein